MTRNDLRSPASLAGRAALYLLFGGMFLAPAAVSAGLLLCLLVFPFTVSSWAALAKQPVIQAALACGLYLVVLTGILSVDPPSASIPRVGEAVEWLQLLLFIPVATLLHDNRRDLNRLLLLCVVGLILRILLRMDWDLLLADPLAHFNLREGYGFPALALGLYSGTALLGLMLLRHRCWSWPPRPIDLGSLLLWLLAVLLLAEVFLATQARSAWLGLLLTALVGALLGRRHGNAGSPAATARWIAAGTLAAGVAVLGLTPQGDAIVERIVSEAGFVEAMLHGEEIEVAHSSIALRWNAQVFGAQTWLERPLTGWGPGPSQQLMAASGNPNLIVGTGEVLKHLHNTYLELLVQTGLVGLALAGLLMLLLLRELLRAWQAGSIPRDLFLFLMSALVFLLLWCLFDFRALNQDWRAFWALLAGTILSLSLPPCVPHRPRRILLVRVSAIGDIVFASPLIAAFRRAYPDAHLAWLTQPGCRPLLEHHPDLDEVIEVPMGHWRTLLHQRHWRTLLSELRALRRTLRARRFDLAVDLQGLLKSGALTHLSGARERVGLGSREGSQWLMTRTISRGGPSQRIGSEYLHLAETLGLPVDGFSMAVHYSGSEAAHADAIIADAALSSGYAILCPFTTRPQKHWVEHRWPILAERLGAELGLPAVLLGGPDDRQAAARIATAAPGIVNLVGETSLLQAAALIDRARLLIGVDTGLSHMGISFDTPSLLLFGSTCPYLDTTRSNARVLYHRMDCSPCRRRPTCGGAFTCMDRIGVDQILGDAVALLEPPQ